MAGDVQEPFSLSFQVDALHSGSVSFGRFELESLSWERRSSFSHNRYLEEVEKYARPGSVTEKKAYFEAHFKKRALLRQVSLESQIEREGSSSDNGSFDTRICDANQYGYRTHAEEPLGKVENDSVCRFDESPESSCCDGNFHGMENEVGFVDNTPSEACAESKVNIVCTDSVSDLKKSSICLSSPGYCGETIYEDKTVASSLSDSKLEPTLDDSSSEKTVNCNDSTETRKTGYGHHHILKAKNDIIAESRSNDQGLDVLKEEKELLTDPAVAKCSGLKNRQPHALKSSRAADKTRSSGMRSRSRDVLSPARVPELRKGFPQSTGWTERQTPLRARTPKQMSDSNGSSLHSSKILFKKENSSTLKPIVLDVTRREKDLRPKRSVTLQPSTPERSETRRPRSVARANHIASANKEINRSVMNISIMSAEGAERRKDVIMPADIIQLSGHPVYKAKPKPLLHPANVRPGSIGEKSQVAPNSSGTLKALTRNLRSVNRMAPGSSSVQCSNSRAKQAISLSKSATSHPFLERKNGVIQKNFEANGSSSTRNHITIASQRKEIAGRKEEANGKKQYTREQVQMMKGKSVESDEKLGPCRGGKAIRSKSILHNYTVGKTATGARSESIK